MGNLKIVNWYARVCPWCGRTVARSTGVRHVITKSSRVGRLPHFLSFWTPPSRGAKLKRFNCKMNSSLDLLILRKVLNSLMTGCVSYFTATLTPYALSSAEASLRRRGGWEKEKESARGDARGTSLVWPHLACVLSDEFLDLRFSHTVYIWLNRCQYWKLLLVFFQRVKKGQSEDTRQDTRSIGHF